MSTQLLRAAPIIRLAWASAIAVILGSPSGAGPSWPRPAAPSEQGRRDSFVEMVLEEVSGEQAWRTLEEISGYYREDATPGFSDAVQHLVEKLLSYGFTTDRIEVERFVSDNQASYLGMRTRHGWFPRSAELWLETQPRRKLADFGDVSTSLATWSIAADVVAQLVYVGDGREDDDYPAGDLSGRIVLTESMPSTIQAIAVGSHGAAGIVSFWSSPERLDHPDLVNWLDTANNQDGPDTFAFVLSARVGGELRDRLLKGEELTVHATVDADLGPGQLEVLSATIPGTSDGGEQVVFIAHLCHFSPSSNDNASGVAVILEIARTLQALIDRGAIAPPSRTIRFLWVPENYGTVAYLSAHPGFSDRTLAAINLDMVGEDLTKTGAVFRVFATPDSLPSYLDALVEHHVRQSERLPIMAAGGSHAPFNYRLMPAVFGSDHYWLNDAGTGVPTVFLSHWPDTYYHTNEDSPDKSDPTELERVAVIALSSLWEVGNMRTEGVPRLLSIVDERAARRAAAALVTASELAEAPGLPGALDRLNRAVAMIEAATELRRRELASVERFADSNAAVMVRAAVERADADGRLALSVLRNQVTTACRQTAECEGADLEFWAAGGRSPDTSWVPRRRGHFLSGLWDRHVGGLRNDDRRWIESFRERLGEGPSVTAEILNLVDGARTVEEIRRRVEVTPFADGDLLSFFGPELTGIGGEVRPFPREIDLADLTRFLELLSEAGLLEPR